MFFDYIKVKTLVTNSDVIVLCKFQPDSLERGDREVEKTLYEKMLNLVPQAKACRTGIDTKVLKIVLFYCELSIK